MNKKTLIKKAKRAIAGRKLLELSCRADDNGKRDFAVIPLCIKEHDGKRYLIAASQLNRFFAFDFDRITAIEEYGTCDTDRDDLKAIMYDSMHKIFSRGEYKDDCYFIYLINKDKEPDLEALRDKLKGIETDIRILAGPVKAEDGYTGLPDDLDREKLERLLASRHYCLDMLFRKDPDGIEKFRKINALLKELTDGLYRKGAKVYRQYISFGVDDEFDDDFMLEADLRFVYNGKESLAELGDEEYYGSDFGYMMNVIYEFCYESPACGASFSKGLLKTDRLEMSDRELDLCNSGDEHGWNELKIRIPELEGIKICNAVNEICVYNSYSVADLLRMNDFWCEVKARYQHILNQNGNRWTSQE